jgi:hypothetical protein
MNYREEFPDHLIIEKYLWVGNVSVEINHIDNDLNRPLDYEEAFKKMKSKLTEESSNAQIFHELTGGEIAEAYWWCETCQQELGGYNVTYEENCAICGHPVIVKGGDCPTYSNAADILNRMREFCGEDKYGDFILWLPDYSVNGILKHVIDTYILNPSALLERAIEFLQEGK